MATGEITKYGDGFSAIDTAQVFPIPSSSQNSLNERALGIGFPIEMAKFYFIEACERSPEVGMYLIDESLSWMSIQESGAAAASPKDPKEGDGSLQ